MRKSYFFIVSVISLVVILTAGTNLFGYPNGVTGATRRDGTSGCSCHSSSANSAVTVTIAGPATLVARKSASYTVTITNTGSFNSGVDIAASGGTLAPGDAVLKVNGNELTHQSNNTGNGSLVYHFTFTAPATTGTATLYATGAGTSSSTPGWNFAPNFAVTVTADTVPTAFSFVSPAGGESWWVGSQHAITWLGNTATNAMLEYSTDNGSNWKTIVASTPVSAGSYAWTVPNTLSAQCKLRISDVSNAANSATSAAFSITNGPPSNSIAAARAQSAGTKVTVAGIVTSPNFHATKNSFYIQDATGGIDIFGGTKVTTALGDSVVVTGWLLLYNNLLEVSDSVTTAVSLSVTNVSSGHTVPAPKVITVAELNLNGENYEGQLITIKNVTKTSGTWPGATGSSVTLTCTANGTADPLSMRITKPSELIGAAEPVWPKDVTGIATQFSTSTGGYQITPRYISDFATVTAVEEQVIGNTYKFYGLEQNYPNPFNPSTVISFTVERSGVVSLKVYNALGTEVATLVDGYKAAGNHTVSFTAANLPSGVYYYRLTSEGIQSVKKMMLMK